MRYLWWLVTGALVLACSRTAAADQRFPAPVAMMTASHATVVALNVGLLVKRQDEPGWWLSCSAEASGDVIGYRSDPGSPNLILAILHNGIATTEDLGCSWMQYGIHHGQVLDAVFDGERPGRVWLLIAARGALTLEIWDLPQEGAREIRILPLGFEIGNAVWAGAGQSRRLYIAAYDWLSESAYVLEGKPDGADWVALPITDRTFEKPQLVHASPSSTALVVRLMGGESDRLAFTMDGRSFRYSASLGGYARALWKNGSDGYLLATRLPGEHLLVRLDAGGTWLDTSKMTFAARAIYGGTERLFALAYALDGSAPLMESGDLGRSWSPAIQFTDVRLRRDCPVSVEGCEAGCLQLAGAGLLRAEACSLNPTDDHGGSVPPIDGVEPPGFGCSVAPAPTNDRGLRVFAWLLVVLAALRRGKRQFAFRIAICFSRRADCRFGPWTRSRSEPARWAFESNLERWTP